MKEKIVLDTSALMSCKNIIDYFKNDYDIIIPIVVVEELDNLKINSDYHKSSSARSAIKHLRKNSNIIQYSMKRIVCNDLIREQYDGSIKYNINDDIIVSTALFSCAKLCTCDLNLQIKAKSINVSIIDIPTEVIYRGYKRIIVDDEELAEIYKNMSGSCLSVDNKYDLLPNQYLLLYNDKNEFIDTLKWTKDGYDKIIKKNIKTKYFGTIKPKDEYQVCALNSIEYNDITLLYGRAGSGKSQLSLSYLMKMLESGEISKIYVVYSYDTLKNAKTLGYEKGSHEEKILQTASIGNILATKFGDISAVQSLMISNQLEIIPTANIRGVEFKSDSAVYVTEAQNLDVYTLKTIVQRCKTGCKQIYEGDIIEQTDVDIPQSGMERMLEVFKGLDYFGCVKLKYNYRNKITEIADMM